MARLIKVPNKEQALKQKKKVRYLFTLDRVIRFATLITLMYIAYKI
jgi:hypothetical protein